MAFFVRNTVATNRPPHLCTVRDTKRTSDLMPCHCCGRVRDLPRFQWYTMIRIDLSPTFILLFCSYCRASQSFSLEHKFTLASYLPTQRTAAMMNAMQEYPASKWDKYLTVIYNEADRDNDGSVSFDECYERLLRFYIKLNQQAPIPPPSRAEVKLLYKAADWNGNRCLNCNEFKYLASELAKRAYTRLLVHKFVTAVVAPFVATSLAHHLSSVRGLAEIRHVLSDAATATLPKVAAQTLQSTHFWSTVFLIFTVSKLGNIVIETVNWFLLDRKKLNLNGAKK